MYYKLRDKNLKISNVQTSEVENLRDRLQHIVGMATVAEMLASDAKSLMMIIKNIADLAHPKNDCPPQD